MAGVDSLLSSFPVPPSFIPPSPLPYDRADHEREDYFMSMQGRMGPPQLPLPALPGGANEVDALMSICNSPAPSRRTSRASRASWRLSRLSDTSTMFKSEHLAPLQPRSSISLPDETGPPTPTAASLAIDDRLRPTSPDIRELLASTPRPLVRRLNSLALSSTTTSMSSLSSLLVNESDFSPPPSDDGEHSDSSIDINTPLPTLMVKAGLLSPHSKILAPPGTLPDQRGVPKDGRDTHRRRNRHRNGKLLREGVGLTTGLGWSDSEDEDAPSALTHRLSTIDLSRRPSMISLAGRSRSQSEYSPSPAMRITTTNFAASQSRSRLSRNSSNASAATFGTPTNSRGGTGSELIRRPRARQRSTSEGESLRSNSSMSILAAYMSDDSEAMHEPMPVLHELHTSHHHPHSPGPRSTGTASNTRGLRKTTSAYPLPRSFSIDSELGSVSSAPYGTLRPLSPRSVLDEKPLPQLPALENPPPRSDSRGAVRARAKSIAPPSAYGGIPSASRKRTVSTSSATSTSSIGSVVQTSVSTGSVSAAAASGRPRMARQTSQPLRRPSAASTTSSASSGVPQLKKRPSLLSLPKERMNQSVVAVGSSPLPSPTPSSMSSAERSFSPVPHDGATTPTPGQGSFGDAAANQETPYRRQSLRSPSAPRTLRLGTPGQARVVPPRPTTPGNGASASTAPPVSGLPTPRGRTTSVTRLAAPRTGAGMTYRSSGVPVAK